MAPIMYFSFKWLLKYQTECFDEKLSEIDLDRSLTLLYNITQISIFISQNIIINERCELFRNNSAA